MSKARAYVYSGDWVADCPRECGNVEYLFDGDKRRASFFCSYCRFISEIDWPKNAADIMGVLSLRPIPHTRNWYPQDHSVAARAAIPHGQSVGDLWEENEEHGVI